MTAQLRQTTNGHVADFARRLDGLHQLIYARGGIKPSNAAVEELAKVLLMRIAAERHPGTVIDGHGRLAEVMNEVGRGAEDAVDAAKAVFLAANRIPELGARLPGGGKQPVWPIDEPLRISRSDVISEAVGILGEVELGRVGAYDPIGAAFDVFLRGRYENAGGLGTYLTPEAVVDLMVAVGLGLLGEEGPARGALMGDPCCGTGRFLVGLLHELRERDPGSLNSELARALFGADQSTSSVAMARVNLMAAGLEGPEVFAVEDSITDEQVSAVAGQMSLILTNPPFGDKKYDSSSGIGVAASVLPRLAGNRRIDPALAFVARCVELLAPGGVAGIILPDGVLDGPVMRDLLFGEPRLDLEIRLEGVVSLPSATFTPAGTTAKTSVVFLRKATAQTGDRAFMARADHVGYLMRKGAIADDPGGNDLPSIARSILHHLETGGTPRESGAVTFPHVAELTSLDASSYDTRAGQARYDLLGEGGREARLFLDFRGKRREPVANGVPFISVLHVDELGCIDWSRARDHRPSTPGQVAHAGEVIVSLLNPAKFRAAVIPPSAGSVQCSAEFGVFGSAIDPYAALALLQDPRVRAQAAPLGRGTSSSRRRIDADDVLSLVVPPFSDASVAESGRRTEDAIVRVAEGRQWLKEIYEGRAASETQPE